MPKGGPRPGSGRPTKEAAAEKARLLAETIAKGVKISPRAYLEGVLASPGSTKTERMRACELLMRFPPEELPSSADLPVHVWNIWGLPPGAQIGEDGKTVVWPNGDMTDPEPLEPFEPTPALSATPQRRAPAPALEDVEPEPVPFETVEATPPQNVTPLRPHERFCPLGLSTTPRGGRRRWIPSGSNPAVELGRDRGPRGRSVRHGLNHLDRLFP